MWSCMHALDVAQPVVASRLLVSIGAELGPSRRHAHTLGHEATAGRRLALHLGHSAGTRQQRAAGTHNTSVTLPAHTRRHHTPQDPGMHGNQQCQ